jgi:hypothetical protein
MIQANWLAERGFDLRSRRVEVLPDATINLTCSGRYRGPYPGWSADLVRDLATRRGVSRVQWQDTDWCKNGMLRFRQTGRHLRVRAAACRR